MVYEYALGLYSLILVCCGARVVVACIDFALSALVGGV